MQQRFENSNQRPYLWGTIVLLCVVLPCSSLALEGLLLRLRRHLLRLLRLQRRLLRLLRRLLRLLRHL